MKRTLFRACALFRVPLWLLVTVVVAFVFHARPAVAQAERPCAAADLDVTFRFGNYQSSTYVVAALSKNISNHACTLSNLQAPTFYTFGQSDPVNVQLCVNCGPSSSPPAYPLLLNPGEIAHQTVRWSTVAPEGASTCKRADVVNFPANGDPGHPAQLIAPSLLPPICSQVAEESYAVGPAFGDDDSLANRVPPTSPLRLFSNFATYHVRDSFVLHAESLLPPQDTPILQPGMPPHLTSMRLVCPTFLLRQRAMDGSTRVQEFSSRDYHCGRRMGSDQPAMFTAGFDAVPPIQPTLLGDTVLQLSELNGPLTAEHVAFIDSNPITLHIVDENAPLAPSADSAATFSTGARPATAVSYDGWKTSFSLVDTSFGKKSGLLDQTTHLVWLRLSATRNKNEDTLRRSMAPRKPLDGWRFATDEEVITMFRHFTGTPTGRTTDPTVVHELQSILGGPLGHTSSTAGEWDREFTNGRIAGFYTPSGELGPASGPRFQYHYAFLQEQDQAETGQTAVADPHRTGWIDGDRTAEDAGFFVVREE